MDEREFSWLTHLEVIALFLPYSLNPCIDPFPFFLSYEATACVLLSLSLSLSKCEKRLFKKLPMCLALPNEKKRLIIKVLNSSS